MSDTPIFDTASELAESGVPLQTILETIRRMEMMKRPKRKPSPVDAETPRTELERVLDADHASAYVAFRQRMRKPLTAYAARLIAREFGKCGSSANHACDYAISKSWQGFEAEWYLSKHMPAVASAKTTSSFGSLEAFYLERADAERQ